MGRVTCHAPREKSPSGEAAACGAHPIGGIGRVMAMVLLCGPADVVAGAMVCPWVSRPGMCRYRCLLELTAFS